MIDEKDHTKGRLTLIPMRKLFEYFCDALITLRYLFQLMDVMRNIKWALPVYVSILLVLNMTKPNIELFDNHLTSMFLLKSTKKSLT